MKRKISAVLLVLVLALLFSSCGGKIETVTDNNGRQYTVKRDKNGFAQTDDKGDLIVYETDDNGKIKQNSDGEDVTSVMDFPGYISDGKSVECESFSIEIPEGWALQNGHTIRLFNEEYQAEITFTLRSTDSVDDCIDQIKALFDGWDAQWKESEMKFDFATAKVITSRNLIENYEKSYIVFAIGNTSYAINTSFNTKLADSVDFESVIGKMTFK
ncbi:MAG: hypothetical protein IJS17_02125 [Clostridia bacterium]|nr:hypothetical protein [Clostridia bacterium]